LIHSFIKTVEDTWQTAIKLFAIPVIDMIISHAQKADKYHKN